LSPLSSPVASLQGEGWEDFAAFGVLDGHGGKEVAQFCQKQLPAQIGKGSSLNAQAALVEAFHQMDEMLHIMHEDPLSDAAYNPFGSGSSNANPYWMGCTAVVCLVRSDVILVANAGDSRAVLSRSGLAISLSEDHKPNLPQEKQRIQRAGGHIERHQIGDNVQYRVNGNLNLSRSIGDLEYKRAEHLPADEQMICATPDVRATPREPEDDFLLLACDGIWDCMSSQEAVDFVSERLPYARQRGLRLSSILEEMLDACVSPDLAATRGLGGDNMTALLVVFGEPGAEPGTCSPTCASIEGAASAPIFDQECESLAVKQANAYCGCGHSW